MTDIDILAAIDAVTAPVCGWCSRPLDPNGPSLDFCGHDPAREHEQQCQTLWHARRAERLLSYREAGHQFYVDAARFRAPAVAEPPSPVEAALMRVPARDAHWQPLGVVDADTLGFTFTPDSRRTFTAAPLARDLTFELHFDARPFLESLARARAALEPWLSVSAGFSLAWFDEILRGRESEVIRDVAPEEDPRAKRMRGALEARRNRNTGPALRRRAPKNVGWGRQ